MMLIKKANGEVVETKKADVVVSPIDFDNMASNEKVVYAAMMAGLQRKTRSQSYTPEPQDVKMLKELGEVRTSLEVREQKQAANDALAGMDDESIRALASRIAARELKQ